MADAGLELENAIPEMPDMSMEGAVISPNTNSHGTKISGSMGGFLSHRGTPKSSSISRWEFPVHKNQPAKMGYPHFHGKPHFHGIEMN